MGLNRFQTTLDDKSGYDHVPLHPQSRTFFGLEWKGYYFLYRTLPFGWKASAYIYNSIGMADTSDIRSLGVPCSNYIDDKHLAKFAALRDSILGQKAVSLKTLKKFAGKTTSFYLLVPGAKLYTNAVYNAISKASRSSNLIPVSGALRNEISHWLFLDTWNGFLPWKEEKNSSISLFSDASNVSWGGSIKIPGKEDYINLSVATGMKVLVISLPQSESLLYTLESLDTSVANSRLDCFIDNKAVVAAWQNQVSKNPALSQVMKSVFDLASIGGLFFNKEPPIVLRWAPKIRKICFCFPTLFWTERSPHDLCNGTFGLSVCLLPDFSPFLSFTAAGCGTPSLVPIRSLSRVQVPQRPRLLLLSTLWFTSSSATLPISVFFSWDRLTKYR